MHLFYVHNICALRLNYNFAPVTFSRQAKFRNCAVTISSKIKSVCDFLNLRSIYLNIVLCLIFDKIAQIVYTGRSCNLYISVF